MDSFLEALWNGRGKKKKEEKNRNISYRGSCAMEKILNLELCLPQEPEAL